MGHSDNLGGGVLLVSVWLSDNTNIFSIYGGGGKLLGGTYLFLLYLGMLIGASNEKIKHIGLIPKAILAIVGVCGICLWLRFMYADNFGIDQKLFLKSYLNPPGLSLMIYAILVLFTIMMVVDLLEKIDNTVIKVLLNFFDYVGSHTLYIFLYHKWWLDYVIPYIPENIRFCNKFISCFLYMGIMVSGSIIVETVMKWVIDFAKDSYTLKEQH